MRLEPFKLKTTCSKCGSKKVRIWYCDGNYHTICCSAATKNHHHRQCDTCHYEWLMRVK